jgi:hypothetical protein
VTKENLQGFRKSMIQPPDFELDPVVFKGFTMNKTKKVTVSGDFFL